MLRVVLEKGVLVVVPDTVELTEMLVDVMFEIICLVVLDVEPSDTALVGSLLPEAAVVVILLAGTSVTVVIAMLPDTEVSDMLVVDSV